MSSFQHRRHRDSLLTAINGLFVAFKTQPNFLLMFFAGITVVLLGIYFNIDKFEWLILCLTIGFVFICEMINTSLEATVDLVTEEWRKNAKISKDIAGGMVLFSVGLSIIIGLIIFLPKII